MQSLTLLSAAVNEAAQVPEEALPKLMYGLKVSFIGMATVFIVLILIMCVLYLFKFIFYTIPNRNKETAKQAEPVAEAAVGEPIPEPISEAIDSDGEIAAAIAAAVSIYMEENHPGTKYRIRSFKRI